MKETFKPNGCIFQTQTGFEHCVAEFLGEYGMQVCCSGQGNRVPLLQLMAIITNNAKTSDIAELVNYEEFEGEDPRIIRLVNDLRERGVEIKTVDYLDYDELHEVTGLHLRDFAKRSVQNEE